jgi:glycosyltransferase involved in cell wall biosynthesis
MPTPPSYRLCLMHTMDPRGGKVGGIETHVRQIVARYPTDFELVFVGVDEIGDCRLGEPRRLTVAGRSLIFVPVARVGAAEVNRAARRLANSVTLRFVLGALRHAGAIRRALAGGRASADLHRYEYAPVARWLGLPAVQMVHGEGRRDQAMDSLLKRHWFIGRFSRWQALRSAARVLCVNAEIMATLAARPQLRRKAELLTVSVDTALFRPRPFPPGDVFKIVFAGRLDAFKDPPLMFATLARLRALLGGKLEFHYVGASDPHRFEAFARIADMTVLHGSQPATGVQRALAVSHAGIFTSEFEGMPCFLLEGLASGRPFGAIALPQFDGLIEPGVSGVVVPRAPTGAATADRLATAFAGLWADIRAGRLDPDAIAQKARPYAVDVQLDRVFATHRALQDARGGGRSLPEASLATASIKAS